VKKVRYDEEGAMKLVGSIAILLTMGAFLAALVLMAAITLTVSIAFGVALLVGMGMLWFGPGAWKPFVLIGMILLLCVMVLLL